MKKYFFFEFKISFPTSLLRQEGSIEEADLSSEGKRKEGSMEEADLSSSPRWTRAPGSGSLGSPQRYFPPLPGTRNIVAKTRLD